VSNPLKKLAGQTVVYGLGTILPRFLNYFLTPVLTRAFMPAEYGIHSELYAYISFLNIIFAYGMETTFFSFNSRLENKDSVFRTAFFTIASSTLVLSLLLFSLSSWISEALSTENAQYSFTIISWCIGILATDALMAIPFARLRAQNKALQFSMMKLANVVINFGLTLFFIKVCKPAYDQHEDNFYASLYNPLTGIGFCFLANLLANTFSLLLLSGQFARLRFHIDLNLLKEMLRYTWPLLILGFAGMINETLDRIILKKLMVDKAEAQIAQGIYGACYKIAILMTIFIQAFRFAAEPFFFSRAKEKDSKKTYALVMKYFVIFCLILFLATLLNLDWIKYLIAEPYWEGLKVVPILLLANLCLGVVYNLSIWYKLSSQTKFGAVISITGAVVTVVINVLFVPAFSYLACAWATLAAYGSMMILSYVLGQKYFPVRYNLRAIAVYVALGFVLYLASKLFDSIPYTVVRIFMNNLLILVFVWIVYKLEINNLKNLTTNVSTEN
jgi:O-antigen/teichoic acid export membrane protein